MTVTYGFIKSDDGGTPDYPGVKAGTDTLTVVDGVTAGATVGQEFKFNTTGFVSYLAFLTYDTSGLTVAPDSAQLRLIISTVNVSTPSNNVVVNVATDNYGSTLDTTDWRNPTQLSAFTVAGTADPTGLITNDVLTISIDPAAIAVGGTTRLILFTDRQAAGSSPDTGGGVTKTEMIEFYASGLLLVTKHNATTVAHNSYATEVAVDAPELWWRLGEASGTTAADASGHSHSGTYVGTDTQTIYPDQNVATSLRSPDGGSFPAGDTVYANARDGTDGVDIITAPPVGSAGCYVGQTSLAGSPGYQCFESFIDFDCSALTGTAISAQLNLLINWTGSFTLKWGIYNFGASVDPTDWRTGTQLAGITVLGSQISPGSGGFAYNVSVDPTAIPVGGVLRLVFWSDHQQGSGTTPTGDESAIITVNSYTSLDVITTASRPTLGVAGLVGDGNTAVEFTGGPSDGSWVRSNAPFGSPTTLNTFSLEGILNSDVVDYAVLCGFENDGTQGGSGSEIDLEFSSDGAATPTNLMELYVPGLSPGTLYNFSVPFPSTPTHIVGTYDHAAGLFVVYVNGDAYSGFAPEGIGTAPVLDANSFFAGGDSFAGDTVSGVVDEVAYYTTALSRSRVLAHYNAINSSSPDALVTPAVVHVIGHVPRAILRKYNEEVLADNPTIYLRCGDSGSPLHDSSGNGYDMPVGTFGSPSYNVPGLQYSDSDGAIRLTPGDELENYIHDFQPATPPYTTGAFTFETIVYLTAFDDGVLCGFIADQGLAIDGTGHVFGQFTDGSFGFHQGGSHAISDNTTYHLAVTFSGGTGDLKLYVNGVLVDTTATGATVSKLGGSPGYFWGFYAANNLLAGTVDEIAWYETALSAPRIAAHYDAMNISPDATPTPAAVAVTTAISSASAPILSATAARPNVAVAVQVPRPIVWGSQKLRRGNPTFIPMR